MPTRAFVVSRPGLSVPLALLLVASTVAAYFVIKGVTWAGGPLATAAIWEHETLNEMAPMIAGDGVVLRPGGFYALESLSPSGISYWSTTDGLKVVSDAGGVVYSIDSVPNEANRDVIVARRGGQVLWRLPPDAGKVATNLAVGNGKVYAIVSHFDNIDDELLTIGAVTGKIENRTEMNGESSGTLKSYSGGAVWFGPSGQGGDAPLAEYFNTSGGSVGTYSVPAGYEAPAPDAEIPVDAAGTVYLFKGEAAGACYTYKVLIMRPNGLAGDPSDFGGACLSNLEAAATPDGLAIVAALPEEKQKIALLNRNGILGTWHVLPSAGLAGYADDLHSNMSGDVVVDQGFTVSCRATDPTWYCYGIEAYLVNPMTGELKASLMQVDPQYPVVTDTNLGGYNTPASLAFKGSRLYITTLDSTYTNRRKSSLLAFDIQDVGEEYPEASLEGIPPAPLPTPTSTPSPSPSPSPTPKKLSYVALGDSVSAGEGINYDWDWTGTSWVLLGATDPVWYLETDPNRSVQACHRSRKAFPHKVATDLGYDLLHLACSGASTMNGVLFPQTRDKGQYKGITTKPAQLGIVGATSSENPNYDKAKPDVVSMTLGMNDVGFDDVLKGCYLWPVCELTSIDAKIEIAKANLDNVLAEIVRRGKKDGKVPLVALATYYDPFRYDYQFWCNDMMALTREVRLTSGEVSGARTKLRKMNDNIKAVGAKYSNVVVVDVQDMMHIGGHELCTDDPWVFGASLMKLTNLDNPSPFHPSKEGQQAIATLVESALRGSRAVSASDSPVSVVLDGGIKLTFGSGIDVAGNVVIEIKPTQDKSSPLFRPELRFDISSSAVPSQGSVITLEIPSNKPLKLFHYVNGAWVEEKTTYDSVRKVVIAAGIRSLSPFALGELVPKVTAQFESGGRQISPAAMKFDASKSSVEKGVISKYDWDFGDGTRASGKVANHVYRVAGEYRAELAVTSDAGAVAKVAKTVVVKNLPPNAVISGPRFGHVGRQLRLDGGHSKDPNGRIEQYAWQFGDGMSSADKYPAHSFSKPGYYQVTLQVTDNEGEPKSTTARIRIVDKGVSATCKDGSTSSDRFPWQACRHHKGVDVWLRAEWYDFVFRWVW